MLVVPASLFQVVAGAVFGLRTGSLVAWLGCTLGMVATFLTGRCFLQLIPGDAHHANMWTMLGCCAMTWMRADSHYKSLVWIPAFVM